jgi:hypothetical protein
MLVYDALVVVVMILYLLIDSSVAEFAGIVVLGVVALFPVTGLGLT